MSEHTTTAPADSGQQAAPPPKPKRPKPKSMLMIGEQTNALFENARLAKERGEKVGWSASIFPQEIAETLGLNVLYPEITPPASPPAIRLTRSFRSARGLWAITMTCAPMRS